MKFENICIFWKKFQFRKEMLARLNLVGTLLEKCYRQNSVLSINFLSTFESPRRRKLVDKTVDIHDKADKQATNNGGSVGSDYFLKFTKNMENKSSLSQPGTEQASFEQNEKLKLEAKTFGKRFLNKQLNYYRIQNEANRWRQEIDRNSIEAHGGDEQRRSDEHVNEEKLNFEASPDQIKKKPFSKLTNTQKLSKRPSKIFEQPFDDNYLIREKKSFESGKYLRKYDRNNGEERKNAESGKYGRKYIDERKTTDSKRFGEKKGFLTDFIKYI